MKNTSITALFLITLMTGSTALAVRPAAFENNSASSEPPPLDEPSRPADLEAPAPMAEPSAMATPADTTPATTIQTQTQTQGDVLQTPTAKVSHLDYPRRGMSKEQVEAKLGKPEEIEAAVGKPPISRWIYADRIVYFEYSSVIHAVAR